MATTTTPPSPNPSHYVRLSGRRASRRLSRTLHARRERRSYGRRAFEPVPVDVTDSNKSRLLSCDHDGGIAVPRRRHLYDSHVKQTDLFDVAFLTRLCLRLTEVKGRYLMGSAEMLLVKYLHEVIPRESTLTKEKKSSAGLIECLLKYEGSPEPEFQNFSQSEFWLVHISSGIWLIQLPCANGICSFNKLSLPGIEFEQSISSA